MKIRFWSVEDRNCKVIQRTLHKKLTEILSINFISIMKLSKGFTLIELLVVIAIIGILSSVVLASLTTARTRGQSASIQSQLSNMRAQAELFYSTNNNNYGTIVAEGDCPGTATLFGTGNNGLGNLVAGVVSVVGAAQTSCVTAGTVTASSWAAAAEDPASTTASFCVDSTGVSKIVTASVADDALDTDGTCI